MPVVDSKGRVISGAVHLPYGKGTRSRVKRNTWMKKNT